MKGGISPLGTRALIILHQLFTAPMTNGSNKEKYLNTIFSDFCLKAINFLFDRNHIWLDTLLVPVHAICCCDNNKVIYRLLVVILDE